MPSAERILQPTAFVCTAGSGTWATTSPHRSSLGSNIRRSLSPARLKPSSGSHGAHPPRHSTIKVDHCTCRLYAFSSRYPEAHDSDLSDRTAHVKQLAQCPHQIRPDRPKSSGSLSRIHFWRQRHHAGLRRPQLSRCRRHPTAPRPRHWGGN